MNVDSSMILSNIYSRRLMQFFIGNNNPVRAKYTRVYRHFSSVGRRLFMKFVETESYVFQFIALNINSLKQIRSCV